MLSKPSRPLPSLWREAFPLQNSSFLPTCPALEAPWLPAFIPDPLLCSPAWYEEPWSRHITYLVEFQENKEKLDIFYLFTNQNIRELAANTSMPTMSVAVNKTMLFNNLFSSVLSLDPLTPPPRPSRPPLHPTIYEDKTGIVLKSTFSSELPGFGYSFTSKGERHACHHLRFNSPPSGRTRRLAQRAASKQGQKQSPGQCKTWRRSAPRMRYLLQGWLWNIARSKSDHFLDSSYGVFVYTGTGWKETRPWPSLRVGSFTHHWKSSTGGVVCS